MLGIGAGAKAKTVMEYRVKMLEEAVSKIGDALVRLTSIEENHTTIKETFARAFERIENLEDSINGSASRPGLYSHVLLIDERTKTNNFLVKAVLGILIGIAASGIGFGFYLLFRSAGVAP